MNFFRLWVTLDTKDRRSYFVELHHARPWPWTSFCSTNPRDLANPNPLFLCFSVVSKLCFIRENYDTIHGQRGRSLMTMTFLLIKCQGSKLFASFLLTRIPCCCSLCTRILQKSFDMQLETEILTQCPPSCFPSSQSSSIFHWHNFIIASAAHGK